MAPKPSLKARLGRRIREVRTSKALSQMDLVRRYDWTLSHYQKIERGVLAPRLSTLVKLAKSFGMSVSELLEGL
jgi:transcriptional regulator with XRE-family HTH domain